MLAWIKHLFGRDQDRELSLAAEADHVELSDRHLVVGLHIGWENHTGTTIAVKGLQVLAYARGHKKEPIHLFPLERFSRTAARKAIQKSPLRPFALPPHDVHDENLRFISKEVFDLPAGTYTVEVEIEDIGLVKHTNRTTIHVAQKIKYRRTDEWDEGGAVA